MTWIIILISFFANQVWEAVPLIVVSGAISIYKFYKYHQVQRIKNDDWTNTISYKAKIESLEINWLITTTGKYSITPHYVVKMKFYNTYNALESYKFRLLERIIPQEIVNIIINQTENEQIESLKQRILKEYDGEITVKEQISNQSNRYIIDPLEKYKWTRNSLTLKRNKEMMIKFWFWIILLTVIWIIYWISGVNLS